MALSLSAQIDTDWSQRVRESQQNAREEYERFRQQAEQDYKDFRRKANEEYARFMENPWTAFESQPAEEIPKLPKPPTPVVVDPTPQPTTEPIPFDGKPLPPKPIDPPQPIEPLTPTVQPDMPETVVSFYGTEMAYQFPSTQSLRMKDASESSVSALWKQLSKPDFDNLIAECLRYRTDLNLCDWGYVMLTEQVAESFCGGHTNEAVVLHLFLLTQSGYQMRIGRADDRLCVLVGSNEKIYHYRYFRINDVQYYCFDRSMDCRAMQIYNQPFPKEKLMSLDMTQPKLAVKKTSPRTIGSKRFTQAKATVVLNQNLIDFFNSCPVNSEWQLYSKASLSDMAKDALYPALREAIEGKSHAQAANILLNFVQTGFDYATDQQQFGYERPLYPDESLYYPFCDCEDRSILFACLVRELMGLDVVLLDYPEHLSTAVCFTEDVAGDYLLLDDKKYVACDPTYIGADIGMTMPSMRKHTATVITF